MRNRTYFALLGLVSTGPKTGYDIKRQFEEQMMHFWSESPGQIYPNLKKLKQDGLVKTSTKSTGMRKRLEYTITKKGREKLAEWFSMPTQPQPVRNELLLKIYLANQDSLKDLIAELERHQLMYSNILKEYPAFTNEIKDKAPDELKKELWKTCLRLGEEVIHARKSWCKKSIRTLKNKALIKGTK